MSAASQAEARAFLESLSGPFPDHIAIIMDGNGRWAESRGWLRVRGHKEGTNSVRDVTTAAAELGVRSLTLYAFSRENWKRPDFEVSTLMRLLRLYLRRERETLMENRIRLKAIGRLEDLPRFARTTLEETIALTAGNDGMVLRLALSYGGRTEMADAARALARDVAAGRVGAEDIDDETLRGYLYDSETPDPDLLIRTAGEMRLSNFLLWQASYAELYVTEECWPEFRRPQLLGAIKAFAGRKRKFGGLLRGDGAAVGQQRLTTEATGT
ncbi:MAG: polyprenyl diphosphate synthase [Planctomycetota bacterium]|nr:polyprenyl diphosphate synthase [Planctomycetota bacterium]MEC8510897.1 polyprenyl diphosphate synthase [Planctomycetota bacterium]